MLSIGLVSVHSWLSTSASAARAEMPVFGNSCSGTSRLNWSYDVTAAIGVAIYSLLRTTWVSIDVKLPGRHETTARGALQDFVGVQFLTGGKVVPLDIVRQQPSN